MGLAAAGAGARRCGGREEVVEVATNLGEVGEEAGRGDALGAEVEDAVEELERRCVAVGGGVADLADDVVAAVPALGEGGEAVAGVAVPGDEGAREEVQEGEGEGGDARG